MKTPSQFVQQYIGKAVDYDHAYGVQCVDAFRCFGDWAGIPIPPTPDNWAQGYWIYRDQCGFGQYFDYITDHDQVKTGDWCIWLKGSSCELSHIAMYYEGTYFGERQDGNLYFCMAHIKNDWAGALRWKGWTPGMIASWEKRIDMYAGIEIIAIGCPDGDKLGVMAADGVQPIQRIDDPYHVYDMKLNGGFFDNKADSPTYGQAYGIRCGLNVWDVPRQGKFIYYAVHNDGSTEVGSDMGFWYAKNQIQCALSPAMVLLHNGKDVEYISPETDWRRTYACSQSMLIRTADRFVFAISKGNLTPDQCKAWAKSIGAVDLVFNDAGGSSCETYGYDFISGTGENRSIANCWTFYHEKAVAEPSEVETHEDEPVIIPPAETHETAPDEPTEPIIEVGSYDDESEDTAVKTIPEQLAKLIDVKSIITIMVMFCLCYLVISGKEIPQNFMQVLIAIMTFYFGYQNGKKE